MSLHLTEHLCPSPASAAVLWVCVMCSGLGAPSVGLHLTEHLCSCPASAAAFWVCVRCVLGACSQLFLLALLLDSGNLWKLWVLSVVKQRRINAKLAKLLLNLCSLLNPVFGASLVN